MSENSSRLPQYFWVGFSLLTGLLGLSMVIAILQNNRSSNQSPELRALGTIADFTLTNQESLATTLAALTNRVWVADIIFTRCAGPCPRMTGQMRSLQNALPPASAARLVTLTTDPVNDSPAVLKKYGQHFDADFSRWTFLTGSKAQIANLASDSLKLTALPVKPEDRKDDADLFIHSTIFVLVDKHAQLRGIFETGGEGVDWTNSVQPRLLRAVQQLEKEP